MIFEFFFILISVPYIVSNYPVDKVFDMKIISYYLRIAQFLLLIEIHFFSGIFTSEMLHIIYEIRRRPLGPFNPLINVQSMLRGILINVSFNFIVMTIILGKRKLLITARSW